MQAAGRDQSGGRGCGGQWESRESRLAKENSSGVRDGEATASRDPRTGGSLRPG